MHRDSSRYRATLNTFKDFCHPTPLSLFQREHFLSPSSFSSFCTRSGISLSCQRSFKLRVGEKSVQFIEATRKKPFSDAKKEEAAPAIMVKTLCV